MLILEPARLLKLTLFHGCFSCLLNYSYQIAQNITYQLSKNTHKRILIVCVNSLGQVRGPMNPNSLVLTNLSFEKSYIEDTENNSLEQRNSHDRSFRNKRLKDYQYKLVTGSAETTSCYFSIKQMANLFN